MNSDFQKIFAIVGSGAETFADVRANSCAEDFAVVSTELGLAPAGRPVYRGRCSNFSVAPAGRPISEMIYRSLRWSYRNRWLPVSYRLVALTELQTLCRYLCSLLVDVYAEKNGTDVYCIAETVCRNELQKWIAETVQNLPLTGGAEKNGSDADAFAEEMQRKE